MVHILDIEMRLMLADFIHVNVCRNQGKYIKIQEMYSWVSTTAKMILLCSRRILRLHYISSYAVRVNGLADRVIHYTAPRPAIDFHPFEMLSALRIQFSHQSLRPEGAFNGRENWAYVSEPQDRIQYKLEFRDLWLTIRSFEFR